MRNVSTKKKIARMNENSLQRIVKRVITEAFGNSLYGIPDVRQYRGKRMNESAYEEDGEPYIDFYDMIDIMEECGWSYTDFHEVSNRKGMSGIRYVCHADNKDSASFDELVGMLRKAAGYDKAIVTGTRTYKYAPENKANYFIVLNKPVDGDVHESRRRRGKRMNRSVR